jgi:hypothetical protein
MRMLKVVPEGLEEIIEVYGDCYAAGWYQDNTVWQRSPFAMRLSWAPSVRIGGFIAHALVGPVIADALTEIRDFGGLEFLRENSYDLWGGCLNMRAKRDGVGTSTHAWGIAADYCPHLGQMGVKPKLPSFIVEAFTKRGFVWGGTWKTPDGMHFQACNGY